jgi:hypothetical protein
MPRVRFAAPGLAVVVGGDGGLIAGIFWVETAKDVLRRLPPDPGSRPDPFPAVANIAPEEDPPAPSSWSRFYETVSAKILIWSNLSMWLLQNTQMIHVHNTQICVVFEKMWGWKKWMKIWWKSDEKIKKWWKNLKN